MTIRSSTVLALMNPSWMALDSCTLWREVLKSQLHFMFPWQLQLCLPIVGSGHSIPECWGAQLAWSGGQAWTRWGLPSAPPSYLSPLGELWRHQPLRGKNTRLLMQRKRKHYLEKLICVCLHTRARGWGYAIVLTGQTMLELARSNIIFFLVCMSGTTISSPTIS